jgi:hypothetical protein
MNDLGNIPEDGRPPAQARPLGFFGEVGVYVRSIVLDVGHRLLRRRRRGPHQVSADYDQGEWAQQAAARNWERSASLEAYVEKSWVDRDLICLVDGRLWRMPAAAYYRMRRRKLAAVMRRFAGDADELVEVGSGTGANLFALALEGRWEKLRGLELSPTGRAVAGEIAGHFGVEDRVTFDEIDLLDAASPGFDLLKGRTVFTYYCLEQLPNDTERVMRNLCAAGIRRAIHLEPSFELLERRSLRDLASLSYVWRQDYQRTILATARRLEAEGLIRIVAIERLYHSPTWRNPPTLLVWEPA